MTRRILIELPERGAQVLVDVHPSGDVEADWRPGPDFRWRPVDLDLVVLMEGRGLHGVSRDV